MKTARYVCTHCGRHFEAEEKEILECPGCFWSTSVKKEEDWVEAKQEASAAGVSKAPKMTFRIPGRLLLAPLLLVLAAAALIVFLPKLKGLFERKTETSAAVKTSPVEKAPSSPVTNYLLKMGKEKKPAVQASSSPLDPLTEEEKKSLQRRLQLTADRSPDEDEKKILEARAAFRTGFSEKIPSQTWTLEGYRQMITQQEKLYKVPLPRSYKKKLEELFNAKYVLASEAFKNGELLKARDLWVESLAFPRYSENIQRHRGVALTMLRPFIADTLSKIGSINSSSVERATREKEQAISGAYAQLSDSMTKKSWQASLDQIAALRKRLDGFAQPAEGQASAYPPGISQVDEDIQATLYGLLKVPAPPVSDLEPIRRDILLKEKIIRTFLPEGLQKIQALYDEALEAIRQAHWQEASEKLREIDTPPAYFKDAQEKLRILKKLEDSGLDSAVPAG